MLNFKNKLTIINLLLLTFLLATLLSYNIVLGSKSLTKINIKKVENFETQLINDNTRQSSFDEKYLTWEAENERNNWTYYNGIMMFALLKTGNYKDFVDSYYNDMLMDDATLNTKKNKHNVEHLHDVDSVPQLRPLFYLSDSKNFKKYKLAIENMYDKLTEHPTLPECANNFSHQPHNKNWQKYPLALDGIYMALPFLMEYQNNAEKLNLKHKNTNFDKIIFERMDWISNNMKNDSGLYSHVITRDGKQTNNISWLRAIGWYAMAQTDLISMMPDSEQKIIMTNQLKSFFDNMIKIQDYKTGMWKNVVYSKGEIPKGKIACNLFETSGSAMLSYAMLKSYNDGTLTDKKYEKAGLKAFNGIAAYNLKEFDFGYYLFNIYKSTGASDNLLYYENCDGYHINEAKGIAPLILAKTEAKKNLQNNK